MAEPGLFSLSGLVRGDDGVASPNPAHDGADVVDPSSTAGRPYRWAQWLAGLDYPAGEAWLPADHGSAAGGSAMELDDVDGEGVAPRRRGKRQRNADDEDDNNNDDGPASPQFTEGPSALTVLPRGAAGLPPRLVRLTARRVVASLRLRAAAAASLPDQIAALASLQIVGAPGTVRATFADPAAAASAATTTTTGNAATGNAAAAADNVPTDEVYFGGGGAARLVSWSQSATPPRGGGSRFVAVIEGGGVSVRAAVTVSAAYPACAPHWSVMVDGPGAGPGEARAIERELNDHVWEVCGVEPDGDDRDDPRTAAGQRALMVLSLQVRALQMHVDALAAGTGKGAARPRGRDRRRPLVWNASEGVFVHRR
jgi:hypothetical protein